MTALKNVKEPEVRNMHPFALLIVKHEKDIHFLCLILAGFVELLFVLIVK